MKTMKLTTYRVTNKNAFETIKMQFAGIAFSREENGNYFIKLPPKYATQLIQIGIITEENEQNH